MLDHTKTRQNAVNPNKKTILVQLKLLKHISIQSSEIKKTINKTVKSSTIQKSAKTNMNPYESGKTR